MDPILAAVTEAARVYDATAETYYAATSVFQGHITYAKVLDLLRKFGGSLTGQEVLDVGCGLGGLLQLMVAEGANCVGVDVSGVSVQLACKKGLRVEQGSIHQLPYPSMKFDRVVANYVINCLPPDGQSLAYKEVQRVLRPGGIFIGTLMHPFFMRMSRYLPTEPHYISEVPSYFEPQPISLMPFGGETFILYLTDLVDCINLIIESGLMIRHVLDPGVPDGLEALAAQTPNPKVAEMIRGFLFNPYAMFIVAQKPA